MKDVKGFEGLYKVTKDGRLYGVKSGKWRKPYPTKTSKYLMVDLWKDNIRYKRMFHRIIAEVFVPNPYNKQEVDHKDDNIYNNSADNLQWITHKENIHKSYNTMSPTRNFKKCELYYKDVFVKRFQSVRECSKWASEQYDLSESMLNKHLKHKDFYIIKV